MPRNRISTADKERIIAAYQRNDDYAETARHLNIAQGTAYVIIRRYQQFGVASRQCGGAHNRKLDEEMIIVIVSITCRR